ncbi:MAG TPA: hypothetical protein VKV23_07725 [Acidimicrobiales bacterium]|nr:hypothetical protein [Acidimicrobiales bacterium]
MPELEHALGVVPGETPDADTLRAIVARARRRRRRRVELAALGVLVAGAGTVAAIESTGHLQPGLRAAGSLAALQRRPWVSLRRSLGAPPDGLRWVRKAGPQVAPEASGGPVNLFCAVPQCSPSPAPLARRTVGDVRLRAFELRLRARAAPESAPATAAGGRRACIATTELAVAVSSPVVHGELLARLAEPPAAEPSPPAFVALESTAVGASTRRPIEVVALRLRPRASRVVARFADGRLEAERAHDGWAAFADDGAEPLPVTVTAYDRTGRLLGSATVAVPRALALASSCVSHGGIVRSARP